MKIAIPTRDCRIDDHFGHCDHYTIYTIENKTIAVREELPSPQGCGCKSGIAADLQRLGVTALRRCWRAIWAKGPKTNSKPTASRSCEVAAATSRQ